MAELLIKIEPGSNYADGDVLCAFNRRRTRCVHAEHVCHVKTMGFNRDGLRPVGCLAQAFRHATHQYLFRRVGKTVERHELATGTVDVFGPESIDVEEFLKRRRKHERHAIFGSTGAEYWYGGRIDVSHAKLDDVWAAITVGSGRLESEEEFQLWPMGRLDIRHHLAVRTVEFTDAEANAFVSPHYELDQDGKPVERDVVDSETGKPVEINGEVQREPVLLAKRAVAVDWKALLGDLGVTEQQVLDKEFAVGRDIVIADRTIHRSKPQPEQAARARLITKPQR